MEYATKGIQKKGSKQAGDRKDSVARTKKKFEKRKREKKKKKKTFRVWRTFLERAESGPRSLHARRDLQGEEPSLRSVFAGTKGKHAEDSAHTIKGGQDETNNVTSF